MIDRDQLQGLLARWTADSKEARRLERNDRERHATSIAMLEAHAQAVEQCLLELERVMVR